MTLKQLVEDILAIDSKTINNNINYLNNLAKTLPEKDKKTIEAITNGMKQQAAKSEEEKKEKVSQPNGQMPTNAQKVLPQDTAQLGTTRFTAQARL